MSPNRAVRALVAPLLAVALLAAGCGSSKPKVSAGATTTSASPDSTSPGSTGTDSSVAGSSGAGSTSTAPRVTAGTSDVTAVPLGTSSSTSKLTTPTTARSSSTTVAPATTTTSNAVTGVVAGTITSSPSCPVERPDQPCPPKPVQATVNAKTGDGSTVASTRSDTSGAYRLALPPGSYTLVVDPGNIYPRCPETAVSVPPGGTVTADIACDSGIR